MEKIIKFIEKLSRWINDLTPYIESIIKSVNGFIDYFKSTKKVGSPE